MLEMSCLILLNLVWAKLFMLSHGRLTSKFADSRITIILYKVYEVQTKSTVWRSVTRVDPLDGAVAQREGEAAAALQHQANLHHRVRVTGGPDVRMSGCVHPVPGSVSHREFPEPGQVLQGDVL